MTKKKNEGIRQQIDGKNNYIIKDIGKTGVIPNEDEIDSFLDNLTSNNEYPDNMEIFTVDRGWEKINKYGK